MDCAISTNKGPLQTKDPLHDIQTRAPTYKRALDYIQEMGPKDKEPLDKGHKQTKGLTEGGPIRQSARGPTEKESLRK